MKMQFFFNINNKNMKKYDDYVIRNFKNVQCIFYNRNQTEFWGILKYKVKIKNIKNPKIASYREQFFTYILYI